MTMARLNPLSHRSSALRWFGLALLLGLLSGCASYGGYPGGSSQSYPDRAYPDQYGANQLVGTVQGVDLNSRRVILATGGSGYGGNRRVDLYFDQRTQLVYQGRAQSVEGLEVGDRIRVDAVQSNRRLYARTIEVVANVRDGYGGGYRDGGGYQDGGSYGGQGGNLRGNIGYVDARARVIEIDRAGGGYGSNRVRVRYDERTVVEYRGQRYRAENLERGDLVRIQARQSGNDWLAERIWVESDVSR